MQNFEVADRKDATDDQWTKILEVGNAEAVQMSANATAKDADYLLHDTTNPGNMYAEATGIECVGTLLKNRTAYNIYREMG
mgnify:CR=1 FL=1